MTLLAGFDFVLEVGQPLLRDMLLRDFRFGNEPLNPPFEITRPVSVESLVGQLHLIVRSVDIDVGTPANESVVVLSLAFDDGSISSEFGAVCPLAGIFRITVPVEIVASGSTRSLAADVPHATAAVEMDGASVERVSRSIGAFITPDRLAQRIGEEIEAALSAQSQILIPAARFAIAAPGDGTLSPLTFTAEPVLRCHWDQEQAKQAIFVFGDLRDAAGGGDVSEKTAHEIPADKSFAASISADAFREVVLCPAIATSAKVPVSALPPECGSSSGFTSGGITVTSISQSFAPGAITLIFGITTSGACFTAAGTVPIVLTSGPGMSFTATPGQPDITISVPWYCYVASLIVGGLYGALLLAIADGVADAVADTVTAGAVGTFGGGLGLEAPPPVPLVDSLTVSAEGLSVAGSLRIVLRAPRQPRFNIALSDRITKSELIASDSRSSTQCEGFSVEWSESREWHTYAAVIEAVLYGRPVRADWRLQGTSGEIVLVGGGGTASLPVISTLETASGTATVTRHASIAWKRIRDGAAIEVSTDPADGNYRFALLGTVSNCAGTLDRDVTIPVQVEGHVLRATSTGRELLFRCVLRSLERYQVLEFAPPHAEPRRPFPWLSADELAIAVATLATLRNHGADRFAEDLSLGLMAELRDQRGSVGPRRF